MSTETQPEVQEVQEVQPELTESELHFMKHLNVALTELRVKPLTDATIDEYSELDSNFARFAAAENLAESSFLLKKHLPALADALFILSNSIFGQLEKEIEMESKFDDEIAKDSELTELISSFNRDN